MTNMIQKDTNNGQFASSMSDKDFGRYIKLKLEKLSSASYMVTNFLPDTEPLKWKIREKAIETVSFVNQGQSDTDKGHTIASHHLINTLQQIIAFLDMGLASGSVSQMNFQILKQEYQGVLISIRQKIATAFEKSVEMPTFLPNTETVSSTDYSSHNVAKPAPEVSQHQKHIPHDNRTTSPGHNTQHQSVNSNRDKNDRQEKIKTFLKGRGWVAIKDIARIIPGVSVKTIQRELSDMVDSGALRKKGERRWSRYTLAIQPS